MIHHALATLAVASTALAAPSGGTIRHGDFSVQLDELGLIVETSPQGIRTIDGPIVRFDDGGREAFAVMFTRDGERIIGITRDTSDTQDTLRALRPIIAESFVSDGASATITTSIEKLTLRTEARFDPGGPYLLETVTLTNVGDSTVHGVHYWRQWEFDDTSVQSWSFPSDYAGLPPMPAHACRHIWMFDDLPPRASASLTFSYGVPQRRPADTGVDVPLEIWISARYPSGLPISDTNGISWGDYDADGRIDIFACDSAQLWRNLDGQSWELAADLDPILTPGLRYGASFGDYNNDGLPDIGIEPRSPQPMDMLKNLGGGPNFQNVAGDSDIIDVRPCCDSETICWGDVDGDGNLDMLLPVYPAWAGGGPGNFFLYNLGPTGPGGAYRFTEMVVEAGLDNPPFSARPEGAQFVDVDFDGDMDCYSNGTLYQNISTIGVPRFNNMTESGSGIGLSTSLDEGAMFFDYDLDGDLDLAIVYTGPGVKIWENYGDGFFFEAEAGIIQSPSIGLNLGMSAEDWDNDGDIDFTTRHVFRRNMLMETGTRQFIVASHTIPSTHLTSATPAWGDWDRDGDLDCALGNWLNIGHFYENTLYHPQTTPPALRRYVRVRPLRDSDDVAGGLETEYAALVQVVVHGDDPGMKRIKFTASGSGYLNQNEYALHFALPDDPAPQEPDEDVHFDVIVDFPSPTSLGHWRIDRHVNPVLGNLNLADLTDREITVFRSGLVVINGIQHPPTGDHAPLRTAGEGLIMPDLSTPMPRLLDVSDPDTYVGIAFDTCGASQPQRVREIIVDGQLADASCGETKSNIRLWDVTKPGAPALVGAIAGVTSERNRRTYFVTDMTLLPERSYRLVAHVNSYRASPLPAPSGQCQGLDVDGGLFFQDTDPCTDLGVAQASVDSRSIYLTFRAGTIGGCLGDIDEDGTVGFADLVELLTVWGPCPGCDADLDADGSVGFADLLIMLTAWGPCT